MARVLADWERILPTVGLLELLSWLEVADLQLAQASEVLPMVREALAHLDPDDEPARELLEACRRHLEWGDLPASELQDLREQYRERLDAVDLGPACEASLRELAEGLSDEEVATPRLLGLADAVVRWGDDPEGLEVALAENEREIRAEWEAYAATPLARHELTVEAVTGHRLLLEGLQDWLEALEHLRSGDIPAGLALARQANRILVALQHFQRQLQSAL